MARFMFSGTTPRAGPGPAAAELASPAGVGRMVASRWQELPSMPIRSDRTPAAKDGSATASAASVEAACVGNA